MTIKGIEVDMMKARDMFEELGWLEDEKQETKQETNFEQYKDEIRDADFDFAVRDGKVIPCDGCPCSECLFFGNHTSCRESNGYTRNIKESIN